MAPSLHSANVHTVANLQEGSFNLQPKADAAFIQL